MDLQQILDAFTANPKLIEGVLPAVTNSEVGKKLIEDRATILYKENIGKEVENIWSSIDNDIFEFIGQRPGTSEDGSKEKTIKFLKKHLGEYKKLMDLDKSLNADERIKALKDEVEKLKGDGAAKWTKEQWDAAAEVWKTEKAQLEEKIASMESSTIDSQKKAEIAAGLATLKYNPDMSDTIKNMMIGNVESQLLKNSKIEDGKVVFLNAEGKPILNATQTGPATAAEVLAGMDAIKEITLKTNSKPGGGAPEIINGKVITSKDDKGNDVQRLDLGPKGTFTSKIAFLTAFEKGMAEAGITKRDPQYSEMETEAYKTHDVQSLPEE